jgi:glycosyltransferase involved in cell wall biosynthesis
MRILMLNYEFPPLGGGGSNACYYLLKEFSKMDINVDLITSSANGISEIETMDESVTIYKVPIHKKDIHYWTQKEILSYSWKANNKVKELMEMHHYDVIHAFFTIPCGALAYLYKKKVPFVVSLRGSDVPGFNERFGIQYVFLKPMIKEIWKKADAVVANSEGLKELALETNPQQAISVIHNGIDISEFTPNDRKKTEEYLQLICVSRLIERKGIRYLLQAIGELKHENIRLTIVGDGNQLLELKNLTSKLNIEDKVVFKGYLDHSKLAEAYQQSDIFVLPSLNEGMSNALLEALAAGLPVVVTDTGGTSELLDGNGVLVPMGNSDTIAEAIRGFMHDPARLRQMGMRSREIAEGMSWNSVSGKYFEVYKEIVVRRCIDVR